MSTVIPAQDSVDIEMVDDKIVISQSTSGGHYADVTFHRIHLPTIIKALEALRDETGDEEMLRKLIKPNA